MSGESDRSSKAKHRHLLIVRLTFFPFNHIDTNIHLGPVYYRLYTKGGAIESYNPIYSNDPFISRILPKSLTPPRTILSLKKYLCKIEGFAGLSAILFESPSSDAVVRDFRLLKLCDRLGVSSREPMALFVEVAKMKRQARSRAANNLIENPDPLETRYSTFKFHIPILDSY